MIKIKTASILFLSLILFQLFLGCFAIYANLSVAMYNNSPIYMDNISFYNKTGGLFCIQLGDVALLKCANDPADGVRDELKYIPTQFLLDTDIENYLKNFDVKIMKKDDRIKKGGEEIIATHKGQKTEYPQIRVFIKDSDSRIHEIKFYSMTGKKYYEIKIPSYSTINGVDFPDKITERITAKKNKIESDFRYSNVKVNTTIQDSAFK